MNNLNCLRHKQDKKYTYLTFYVMTPLLTMFLSTGTLLEISRQIRQLIPMDLPFVINTSPKELSPNALLQSQYLLPLYCSLSHMEINLHITQKKIEAMVQCKFQKKIVVHLIFVSQRKRKERAFSSYYKKEKICHVLQSQQNYKSILMSPFDCLCMD